MTMNQQPAASAPVKPKSAMEILMEAGEALARQSNNLLSASPHNMTERAALVDDALKAWREAQVAAFMAHHAELTGKAGR